MKQTIDLYDFREAFSTIRPDNFSYEGLELLFNWFEDYEIDTGEEVELDVIGICCEWNESSIDEVINDYIQSGDHVYNQTVADDLAECEDDSDRQELIVDWLNEQTMVAGVHGDNVIFVGF